METRSLLLATILLLGLGHSAGAIVSAPKFLRGQRADPLNPLAQGQQIQTDPRLQEADRLDQQARQLYQQ
jgi:hypothetical protein